MKSVSIKKAKTIDAQRIRKLEERVWNEAVVNKYDVAMFVRFGYVYIALHGAKLVGAIISYPTRENEIYVCDWVIDPRYRGLGIGERLYKKLIRDVADKSIVSFIDPKNTASLKAHLKYGFKIVKSIRNPYGLAEGYKIFVRLKFKSV